MRGFWLLIVSFLTTGSFGQKSQAQQGKKPGLALYESGFLKFADTHKIDALKTALIDSFDIYDDANFKIAHIDAEELAEFSFETFMPALNSILEKRNFKLSVKSAPDYQKSYKVSINGTVVQLYTEQDLKSSAFWETAPRNFFKEVNLQLHNAQLPETFYLLYGGNDLHVLLLTAPQQKIIVQHYKGKPNEIPYLP